MGLGILPPPGLAPKAPDVQDFTSSGTWTKPDGAKLVLYEGVGGGADASGSSGGNGGNYVAFLIDASSLGSTESVTVGASYSGATIFVGRSTGSAGGGVTGASPNGIFDGGRGGDGTVAPGNSQYGAGGGRGSFGSGGPGGTGGASGDTARLLGGNGASGTTTNVPAGIPGGGGSAAFRGGAPGAARITTYF